jgi:uncharacterized protein YneR
LVDQSELFNVDTSWILSGRPAVQTNVIVSPEGAQNGSRLAYGVGNVLRYSPELTFTNGYSYSIFVKKDVGRYVTIYAAFFTTSAAIGFDLDEGTCQAGGVIEPYGDEWYRISVSNSVAGDADKSGYFYLYSTSVLGATSSTSGNKLYVYGAQIEDGSYATSYIPTYSVSATRAQDTCDKTNASGEINSTEGVLYTEIAKNNVLGSEGGLFLRKDTSNSIRLNLAPNNRINLFVNVGGVLQVYMDNSTFTLEDYNKIAVKYKLNDYSVFVNGTKIYTDTSALVPADMNELKFNSLYGKVNAIQVYKEALTDAELATLTTI